MVVGDADKVRVTVLSRGSVVDFDVASVTPENGKNVFTSALNRILSAGQTVQVVALKEEAEVGTADYTLVRSVLFDWGRVRAYFSLGSTVAKQTKGEPPSQETEFTNAEWWLGLNLDYNWYSRLKPRLADRCARPQRVRDEIDRAEQLLRKYLPQFRQVQSLYRNGEKPNREWLKNELRKMRIYEVVPIAGDFMQKNFRAIQEGYTEACVNKQFSDEQAALDSLKRIDIAIEESRWGVKKEPEADVVADGASLALRVLAELQRMDNNYIAGGWLFNTSFEGRLSQAPITDLRSEAGLSVILQNPQSAVFELAAYAPVFKSWTSWRFGDQDNTLFIAPIVKAGTIVPTGKHEGVFSDARQNTYHYWNAGFRFGHLQLDPRPKSVAPELLSHLDVTVGKFDNFRTPRRRPPTGEPLEGDQFNRDLRVETHGRFKIPFMPIYLGFTSNFGPGPDDTRVFFGTRFDIGEAIAKVIPRATR
jgi:hypothetical protein